MTIWDEMDKGKATGEDETTHCPVCMSGMQRSGFSVYSCYICEKRWRIVQEGFISDKKLAEMHKDGLPMDIG